MNEKAQKKIFNEIIKETEKKIEYFYTQIQDYKEAILIFETKKGINIRRLHILKEIKKEYFND